MYLKGQKLEIVRHSLHREYKNVQESVLTNVNIQRTGKTSLQIFVYFIFDGSFICRILYILRPSSVHRHSICPHNWRHIHWLSTTYICRFYVLHRQVTFLHRQVGIRCGNMKSHTREECLINTTKVLLRCHGKRRRCHISNKCYLCKKQETCQNILISLLVQVM